MLISHSRDWVEIWHIAKTVATLCFCLAFLGDRRVELWKEVRAISWSNMPSRKQVETLVSLTLPAIGVLVEKEALNIAKKSVALFPIDSCEGDDDDDGER